MQATETLVIDPRFNVDRPLAVGERYSVVGWPIVRDGRKLHAGTAIFDSSGAVRARSRQLWLMPKN